MKIEFKTQCDITVTGNDAISNVYVDGSITDIKKLGTFIDDKDGTIKYVCNHLNIKAGGMVRDIKVVSNGFVSACNAITDKIHAGRGGTVVLTGGTNTGITECFGHVDAGWFAKEAGINTFERISHDGYHESGISITAHEGVSYTNGSLSRGAIMIHSGGTLERYTVSDFTYVTIRFGGRCNDLTVNSGGVLRPSGGKITNTKVNFGGRLELCHLSDDTCEFIEPLDNVENTVVSSGGKATVRHYVDEPIPDISKLTLEEGAIVEFVSCYDNSDSDEDWDIKVMHNGDLIPEEEYIRLHTNNPSVKED